MNDLRRQSAHRHALEQHIVQTRVSQFGQDAAVEVVLFAVLDTPMRFKARAVSSTGSIRFEVFGPDGRQGTGGDAAFPSTRRFVDLLFRPKGAFNYLRDFSAPMTLVATDIRATRVPIRRRPRSTRRQA